MLWVSQLWVQFAGSEQSQGLAQDHHSAAVTPLLFTVAKSSQLMNCVEMLTWVLEPGHSWMLSSMLIPPGAHPALAGAVQSLLLHFASRPAALLRTPHVTCLAWVTSGNGRELAAVSGHGYSCHLCDPVPLPSDALYSIGWRHRCTQLRRLLSPGDNRHYLDPDRWPKSTRDAIWHLLWLLCPHQLISCKGVLLPTGLGSRGSWQSILAVGWSKGWGGVWKRFNHF